MVCVGGDFLPAVLGGDAVDAAELRYGRQFFFAGEIVADVVVVDLSLFPRLRFFDEDGYGNRGAGALSEYVVFFLAAAFAGCAGIAAQVEDVEAAEFFSQAFAQAVGGVGFYPAGIGDEADDAVIAFFFDAVGCPADGADVAVVEGVFVGGGRLGGVGLADAFIQVRIGDIGVIVVGRFLSGGIGRVADDDADVQGFLPFAAGAVVHQHFVEIVAFFVHLEGVGEADAGEGLVCRRLVFAACQVVVGGFDIDGGDVVGEQDDFVGVYFGAVFLRQASARDDAALQQAGDEGACTRERVEDVHTFILQAAVELAAQDVFDAVDDEVHDFDRGVNDAEAFGHAREGVAEEFVVKLDDDFLFARRAVDAFGAHLHGFVEFLQAVAFFV